MSSPVNTLEVATRERTQFVDITPEVSRLVAESGVKEGVCHLYVPHTTAAVTINENADPAVAADILTQLNKVIPFQDAYRHSEGNSAAHIKSSLVGANLAVPVSGGRLLLGTWQGIYFCEFDGPRRRKVLVKVAEC
ncbi:MAG: secondary thiamine-phosphate synthase enzyme YjbQ [Firmicutes bacterium]|nr:secondary thiamine-phosphate synthase enzyme YjbQ [Bacillota bacterium]